MGLGLTDGAATPDTGRDPATSPSSRPPRYLPLVIAIAFAAFLVWRGRLVLAAGVLVVAGLVTFVPAIDRAVRRAFTVLARWLGNILFGAIDLLVVVPFWALGRVFRRDPLRHHRTRRRDSRFTAPTETEGERKRPGRPFSDERPAPSESLPRRTARAVPRWIGIIVLLVVANYLVGWAWDIAWGHGEESSQVAGDRIHLVTNASDLRDAVTAPDSRADLANMRDKPWWKPYLRELQLVPDEFYPYLLIKPLGFKGEYINVDNDWARATWNPTLPAGQTAPVVWFFGGSTMFGEGQRDDHTIPSEVSRLAEADGLPIKAVNYGQRAFTNWQEMLLYENRLSHEEAPPQFAVFYDGLNEKDVQVQKPLDDPSFYDLDQLAARATNDTPPDLADQNLLSQLWDAYRQHSFLDKVVGKVADQIRGTPAGAEPIATTEAPVCYREVTGRNLCRPVDVVVKNVLSVYHRGRAVIQALSTEPGVEPVFFWQPQRGTEPVLTKLADQVDEPTIDISGSLDGHQDTYIDGGHTNEDGARLVAAAQWKALKPKVQAWYAAHGGPPPA